MAIHEVWVRRIVAIEETVCIPVEVEDDPDLPGPKNPDLRRRSLARKQALFLANEMIANDRWQRFAQSKTVALGEPDIVHVSGDVLQD